MRRVSAAHGFTLIEIVVILAVIGLLAAALVPAILGYIEEGRIQTALADLKDIKTAFIALAVDRGAFPPQHDPLPLPGAGDPNINGGGATSSFCLNSSGAASTCHGIRFAGGEAKRWRGPYINREVKTHPWGGQYLYDRAINVIDIKAPGVNDVAIVLSGTSIPATSKQRIDQLLDDGCANAGVVQVEGATSCTDFVGGVVPNWGTSAGGELLYVIAEDDTAQ